jgi:Cellulose biosynthesis protein BcsS
VRISLAVSAVAISATLLGASPGWAQSTTSGNVFVPTGGAAPVPVVTSSAPPFMEAWAGLGVTHSFFGGWVGGVVALNPQQNVWDTGFVLRGEGLVGQYDVDGFNGHGTMSGASWMFGYRQKLNDGLLTGYIGANYEHHDTPDPFTDIRGTEVGFRALVEYYQRLQPNWDFYGQASYSTAFDATFLFARSGFQLANTIWAGPETAYYRNESDYSEYRLGGFVRFENAFFGNGITLSGGWVNAIRREDDDGWYAALNIDFQFRH